MRQATDRKPTERGGSRHPGTEARQRWRIHLRPGRVDVTQRCVNRSIVGIGGPISPPPESKEDYLIRGRREYEAEKIAFKRNTNAIFDGMAIDDLVWTRTPEGSFYLGRITGGWRFQDDMSETDVVIVRPCDWQEVGPDDVLPDLNRHFKKQATVQRIRDLPEGFEKSRELYSRLCGEDRFADELDDIREEKINSEEAKIRATGELEETEKEQLIMSRRGQGRFRQFVLENEPACRVTGMTDRRFLIASHIKPWRDSTNAERLDGENGLLLSPSIDLLFDRGFISFEDDGTLLISPVVDHETLEPLGVPNRRMNVGGFTTVQKQFLSHHRQEVFLKAGQSS